MDTKLNSIRIVVDVQENGLIRTTEGQLIGKLAENANEITLSELSKFKLQPSVSFLSTSSANGFASYIISSLMGLLGIKTYSISSYSALRSKSTIRVTEDPMTMNYIIERIIDNEESTDQSRSKSHVVIANEPRAVMKGVD